ncbi:ABC transporter permease [Chryseolinea sp. H1M3-3]|uniref:ABC transporter permease n=1 Tax=Chryseolinea sp. H1M3-3 TaxID=3034144 RepID=UPI0023EA99A4|nr:ABC transporter permease [Chryseolinea sp. H1M3-3]
MNYLKNAFKVQAKYRWFTLINLLGLSLGIVCSTIIFLYVDFHRSTDTYHQDTDLIYRLVHDIHTPNGEIEYESGSALPMAETLNNEYSQIEKTSFFMRFYSAPTLTINHSGKINRFKESNTAYADNKIFELFTIHFINGDKSTALNKPQCVVLTEKQALKYFGTVDILGKSININNRTDLIVTGVVANLPKNTDLKFDVLVSLPTLKVLNPKYQDQNFTWVGSNNWIFIKLREGSTPAEINKQLPSFVQKYLGANFKHWDFHLQALSDMHFDLHYGGVIKRTILWILSGVAIALLCIVCINYVNLSIALAYKRSKEIAIRKCLGSTRGQLFFQFMVETVIMVFLSIGVALLGSYLALPVMNGWLQVDLTLFQILTYENIVNFIFFGVVLILLAGYYPAIIITGFDPLKALAGKTYQIAGINHALRKALICIQYTVSLLFLICTFVVINQVDYLLKNELGFSKDGIITINLPKAGYSHLQTFRNELERTTGIETASLHYQAPMSMVTDGGFIKYDHRSEWEDFIVRDRWADDHFLDAYSLKLVAGRNIVLHDSLTEVIVNETLLKKLSITNVQDGLGKTILFDNSGITGTIVGVVRDFHNRSLQGQIEPIAIYSFPGVFNQVGVKLSSVSSQESIADIEQIWKNHFPNEVFDFSFLEQSIANMYQLEQTTEKIMRVFAIVSLVICSMGILGLSMLSTVQRTKEIGIRKVLGANVMDIILMLSKQYLMFIAIAFIISIPLAYQFMDFWLSSFAYRISLHWIAFIAPAILIILLTFLLVGGQSLKTALTNPTKSLKQE